MKFFFKRNRLKLFISFIVFALVGYFIILPWTQYYRAKKDIMVGDLKYFPSIGWIDMGHADPRGPKKMVNEIDKHRGGTLTYYQDMKKSFCGVTLIVRMTNRYSIPVDLGKRRDGILRYVFEDVSHDFEKLQNSYPFKPFCGKGIGDINGDRFALLRSLNMRIPSKLKHPATKSVALEKFKNNEKLFSTSSYLDNILPNPIKVWKYDTKTTYHIVF